MIRSDLTIFDGSASYSSAICHVNLSIGQCIGVSVVIGSLTTALWLLLGHYPTWICRA